jgi:hypothetical protein
MPSTPTDTDLKSWHRFFAIECNNRAWDLAARTRDIRESLEMLNAAHSAAWHWGKIGIELNNMRAKMLLARVHTLVGYGSSALALASEARSYFVGRETPAWELAFVHAIYAHAAHLTGDRVAHRSAYEDALAAAALITQDEDRKVFRETFDRVPTP